MTDMTVPEEIGQTDAEKKQAMLAAIIESSEDAIISKTLDGIITSWNRAAERMFGYNEAEVIGQHISILIPPERKNEEDIIIDLIRNGHRVQHFQTIRITKLGHRIPISLTVSPIKSSTGVITGASKIVRDLSELHKHAQTLELLLSVGRSISEKLDREFILQRVTDITIKLTGAESGSFQPVFDGKEIQRTGDTASYLAVPVISVSGETIGALTFGHSNPGMFNAEHEKLVAGIASQAAIGVDNARLYEEVKQLNNRKDEFIGIAGHELRTPITTIKGYLQLLEAQATEGMTKEFSGRALRQVNKLNRLITDLLDVTRIHAGRLEYTMNPCQLLALVKESVETVCQMDESHVIESNLPAEDITVLADGMKIEQVIVNFLTNAIKYSPDNKRIVLTVEKRLERAVVSVRDFGIGIPKEHLERVFLRYYRVQQSNYAIDGLGIGLYISREIVERHNGSIWVESEEGQGSTFYFDLPLASRGS
jgi:PAS domain S-box-containing protein